MKDSQKTVFFLVVILCLSGVICFACILIWGFESQKYTAEEPLYQKHYVHYVTDLDPSFEALWSRSGIVLADMFGPTIFVENNIIYFFGKIKSSDPDGIIALSASDPGVVIWHIPFTHSPTNFFVNLSGVYTATAGDPEITAYDLLTGETKWTTIIRDPPTRGISSLYETDGKVYVGARTSFILDSETGETLAIGIVLIASKAKEPFLPRFFGDIVFKDNHTISYSWYPGLSKIHAIDHNNDVNLWTVENAAGNPVLFEGVIYYLTTDGKVIGVNADTGEFIHSLQFDSPSLGSIAVDQSTGIIYVWLQDSNQLFAFKIVNPPGN